MSASSTSRLLAFLSCAALLLGGCAAKYHTPGGPLQLDVLADADVQEVLAVQPAAPLPASLVTVRVQEPGYKSYAVRGHGTGRYSVVTVRDVEDDADFQRIEELPHVKQVLPMSRLLLPSSLQSDKELRLAAARLHADMILVYTFDTAFFVGDAAKPLTVFTLGLSPHKDVRVTSTASAVLLDVRTGYVYGACEASADRTQLASAWTDEDTVDRSRRETEGKAFDGLVAEFVELWPRVAGERTPQRASAGAVGARSASTSP